MVKTLQIDTESQKYSGLIFDIKHYAIHDGPGIRTTIFMKGCPLSCKWCHNPESRSVKIEKMYSKAKCIGCQQCVEICPQDACSLTANGIITDKDLCIVCGECADKCPTKATEMSGYTISASKIIDILKREIVFFDQSGGGVTFSGGEPLLFPDFLNMVLDLCGENKIHRTVDTSGYVKKDILLDVAKRTDLFLYDIKMMDPQKHKKYTGVDNQRILDNLWVLSETDAKIIIRMPLIKNINDSNSDIEQAADFISRLPGKEKGVDILPYHDIAIHKHEKLGQTYDPNGMTAPDEEKLNHIIYKFRQYGIAAKLN